MCIPTKLQQNIISFTKDGEHIARFLTETMRGKTPGVKVNHRLEAAKHLIKYGFTDTDCGNASVRPEPVEGQENASSITSRHSCESRNPEEQGGDETSVQSPLSPGRGLG